MDPKGEGAVAEGVQEPHAPHAVAQPEDAQDLDQHGEASSEGSQLPCRW